MEQIQWMDEVLKRKETFIKDTCAFLQIKSVLEEDNKGEGAPFGEGIKEALEHILSKGEGDGFIAKNLEGYAGHLEMGIGEEILGILCHVDVVPEGEGWTTPPYSADIRDGKIFARGAIDDKGPTMAAYYAMKIVKDLGLPLQKRVRMIIGTDEESGWGCVDHYFKHEEMPTIGFAPDADFPIIHAEKGIIGFYYVQEKQENTEKNTYVLQSFHAGNRLNVVPDFARAILDETPDFPTLVAQYNSYLIEEKTTGKCYTENGCIYIEINGLSAHGMEPDNGRNAGLLLLNFLATLALDSQGKTFVDFGTDYFVGDSRGENLGIRYTDDITGDLTINVGQMTYTEEIGGRFGLNLRYPVTTDAEKMIEQLHRAGKEKGFVIQHFDNSPPHHVAKDHELIKTLQRVYEEQTGEVATLLSTGGGTYARSLEAGVAFGPLFPGKPDVLHQKDEYVEIDDLLKAIAIYAQAIYELAK